MTRPEQVSIIASPCACRQEMMEKLAAKAEELAQNFKDDWQPVADNLDKAMKAFDDLEGANYSA